MLVILLRFSSLYLCIKLLLDHPHINLFLALAHQLDIRYGGVLFALEQRVDLFEGLAFGFYPEDRLQGSVM
jgi:hypothetical protein